MMASLARRNDAGQGRIVTELHGSSVAFAELSATYPLKLLSPRVAEDGVAIVYVLSYGGGLVGGDCIKLRVDVGLGSRLLLLSQGSTKVFKTRQGGRAANPRTYPHSPSIHEHTTQSGMEATVSSGSSLFLLPDPVTCFRSAAYNQMQTFRLQGGASLALLDWVTSGRKSLGEEWAFSRYYSINEVWVDKQRVARDVLLLETENPEVVTGSVMPAHRTLAASLAPYSCYATVILYGPLVRAAIRHLSSLYGMISVFKTREPADLVWSLSPISSDAGSILRVAGKETETVRRWLSENLLGLADIVGAEAYSRAFK